MNYQYGSIATNIISQDVCIGDFCRTKTHGNIIVSNVDAFGHGNHKSVQYDFGSHKSHDHSHSHIIKSEAPLAESSQQNKVISSIIVSAVPGSVQHHYDAIIQDVQASPMPLNPVNPMAVESFLILFVVFIFFISTLIVYILVYYILDFDVKVTEKEGEKTTEEHKVLQSLEKEANYITDIMLIDVTAQQYLKINDFGHLQYGFDVLYDSIEKYCESALTEKEIAKNYTQLSYFDDIKNGIIRLQKLTKRLIKLKGSYEDNLRKRVDCLCVIALSGEDDVSSVIATRCSSYYKNYHMIMRYVCTSPTK